MGAYGPDSRVFQEPNRELLSCSIDAILGFDDTDEGKGPKVKAKACEWN